jgi:hypothetical protein
MGEQIIKAHCPECGPDRKAFVKAAHSVDWQGDDGAASRDTGMILECCGCERVYMRRDVWFSEWENITDHPVTGQLMLEGGTETKYWPPASSRKRPHWISAIDQADHVLGNLLSEMYDALAADLRVLAAVAVRTALDRASEKFSVDPAKTFREKLDHLGCYGHISHDEERVLSVLIDAGSAAAHRAWKPSSAELATMVDVLESFLHRSFVIGDGIARLKASVPPRPQRSK